MEINPEVNSRFPIEGGRGSVPQGEVVSPEIEAPTEKIQARIQDSAGAKERMEKLMGQISTQPSLAVMSHSNLDASRTSALIGQP